MEKITSITFKRTSNIFVNAGIVGLYKFAQKYQTIYADNFPTLNIRPLGKNELTIHCDKLLEFLEEVYYYMGSEVYDTVTSKQEEEAKNFKHCNLYYSKAKEQFMAFPKIKSYGLPDLFTNGRPKNTKTERNQNKIKNLQKEDSVLAQKFIDEFEKRKLKLGSVIYFNEPYTTIPRFFKPTQDYLIEDKDGTNACVLTGKHYKKLMDANNNSAFIKKQGISNFKSFFSNSSFQISWKTMYLIRFSPVLCYYSYPGSFDTMVCNFFNSNNLENIADIYDINMFRTKEELKITNYVNNFKLHNFKIQRKSDEETEVDSNKDAVWESEIAFMLLYTFYKNKFELNIADEQDVYFGDFDKIPVSLITFKADKFANTLRPNSFEEYNNVKFILRLFFELEKVNKITFQSIWFSLRLNTPKAQTMKSKGNKFYGKGKAIERQIRASVLGKVLKGKTIIHDIEKLFFDSFKYLIDSKANPGYRSYKKLVTFLLMYEKSINFGNIKNMNAELQQQAVNLGKSVGIKMLALEGGDKRTNAKNGRKYIIRLHKARTQEQFTEALIGIMKKYTLSNKVIETIDKDNFLLMRQYTVIGALNIINGFLSSNNNDSKE